MPRLGELLTERGTVTAEAVGEALTRQREEGGRLGEILTSYGWLNPRALAESLGAQSGTPYLDLVASPPDASLLHEAAVEQYARLRLLPHRRLGDGRVVIATAHLDDAAHAWAFATYGDAFAWAPTTAYDLRHALAHAFPHHLSALARFKLWRERPERSARHLLADRAGLHLGFVAVLAILALTFVRPGVALGVLFAANAFYAATLAFKVALFLAGRRPPPRPDADIPASALPVYTVLVPLYREAASVPALLASLRALDYPRGKLDIKLIVEADDAATYAAIVREKPEAMFEIVRVPKSSPRTKPKACNYALRFARGEYLTIYDAEDRPDPRQLKRAVAAFREAPPEVACLQARLNYYNREEGWLPRFFALEYGLWFDLLLPGLERLGMPIPLGGTSNHLRTAVLRAQGEWDPFNVTEDADLGIRLALAGYRTRVLESYTLEEAPLTFTGWLRQRTRWIKGYLQTYFVAMRAPRRMLRTLGWRGFLGVQLFIGAPCLVFLLGPLLWGYALHLWLAPHLPALPGWLTAFMIANLIASPLLHVGLALAIVRRRRWGSLVPAALLFPLYWLLHTVAAVRALAHLLLHPHRWEKTDHGQSTASPAAIASLHAELRR